MPFPHMVSRVMKALVVSICFTTVQPALAEIIAPWKAGQDMNQFYAEWCSQSDLDRFFFSRLSDKHRAGVNGLVGELLWSDFSEYLLNEDGSVTSKVIDRMRSSGDRIDPEILSLAKEASGESVARYKLVKAHNDNLEHHLEVIDRFQLLATSDPNFTGALLTYMDCRIIRNVKSMEPFIAKRIAQVKTILLPRPVTASPPKTYSGHCSCAGGNVCYGPRGGRFCITSGGNKRYGI